MYEDPLLAGGGGSSWSLESSEDLLEATLARGEFMEATGTRTEAGEGLASI